MKITDLSAQIISCTEFDRGATKWAQLTNSECPCPICFVNYYIDNGQESFFDYYTEGQKDQVVVGYKLPSTLINLLKILTSPHSETLIKVWEIQYGKIKTPPKTKC